MRVNLDRWLPIALAAASLAYLLPLRRYGVAISDDGWYLHPVLRMRGGEILYRDVFTFYAPLEHHLLEWLFRVTGPSIVAARTLLAVVIATSAALTYRLARRAAPPALAWLPAAVYPCIPGPWPKAFFGLCTALFFVALARALERPGAARFAVVGLVAGATLATRQDLGLAQLGIALVAAPVIARAPVRALPLMAAMLGGWVAVVAPVALYYAAHGALRDLLDAVFLRASAQLGAFPPALPAVLGMRAGEGRGVAWLMLLPLPLYLGWAAALLVRLRREGMTSRTALQGALLAYAVATLSQAYHPVLLVRLLQSALPFYVLATWAIAAAHDATQARVARAAVLAVATAAGVGLCVFVVRGVERVHPGDLFTGSARVLRYDTPLEVLGDTLQVGFGQADEARQVRAFYAAHTQAGDPTAAFPTHPLYWAIVDRPNPTRFVADHAHGNFVMSVEQKRAEAERLRASGARFVIAEQQWYAGNDPPDPLRELLWREFRPVRSYVSVLILERDDRPDARALGALLRRTIRGTPAGADLAALREIARANPGEPLPWKLLGARAHAAGAIDEAVAAYHRAAALDPGDASSLERSATALLAAGRREEAAADVARARSVRESPTLRELTRALEGNAE